MSALLKKLFGSDKKLISRNNHSLQTLDHLTDHTELETLVVESRQLRDLSGLQNTPHLTSLHLSSCWPGVIDLSPLERCRELRQLTLGLIYVPGVDEEHILSLRSWEVLGTLPALTRLSISALGVTGIDWLAGLERLEELDLSDNRLASLEPLERLTGLHTLDLSRCGLTECAPLCALTELEVLRLEGNALEDLHLLAEALPALQELYAGENDLPPDQVEELENAFDHLSRFQFS